MSEVQPFTFPATGQPIRVLGDAERPLIHHGDACKILEHTNPSVAIRMVDEDERVKLDMRAISAGQTALNFDYPATGNAEAWFLTEAGFYNLAFTSKAKGAHAFRRWVTHEVLPEIRRTGSYSAAPVHDIPRTLPEALRAYADAVEQRDAAEARIAELEPAAGAWDALAESKGDYSLREAAQILNRDPLISTGQNRLARYLRDIGWTDNTKQPYQREVDNGRLVRRATSYPHPHTGERESSSQVRITPKGLKELRRRMAGQQALVVIEGSA